MSLTRLQRPFLNPLIGSYTTMPTLIENLTRQLQGDEGTRATVYKDSLGFWTIGTGRLVDPSKKGCGLRPKEIAFMLANDIEERTESLNSKLPWMVTMSPARQAVLLNMSFQLGVDGLLTFVNTLKMAQSGDFDGASKGMLQSKWASQTPQRAKRLSEQMRLDIWQYTEGA
jgi:lysozyme